jgi:hypothetical protein
MTYVVFGLGAWRPRVYRGACAVQMNSQSWTWKGSPPPVYAWRLKAMRSPISPWKALLERVLALHSECATLRTRHVSPTFELVGGHQIGQ